MSEKIEPTQLKPGDILLYHGGSFVSRMIRLFDGSEYSHASIYDGSRIAEAVATGIVSNTVDDSVKGAEYVDVYRFRSDSGAKLGDPDYPSDPVMRRIAHYLANHERYAYEQIVLLALLTTTRRLPFVGWVPGLGGLLRTILDSAADVLNDMIAAGREPMICSELAYRCYTEAGDKYGLRIVGAEMLMRHSLHEAAMLGVMPLTAPERGDRELQDLAATSEAFLRRYAAAKAGRMPMAAVTAPVVPDFVTPRDLKASPNLALAGRLAG